MFLELTFVHWLVVVSALISVAGAFAYIRDTSLGKTKPNKVSWLLWAVIPLTAVAAAISAGADIWPTVRIFLAGFLPLVILIVSFFNPQSYWKLSTFDFICGGISLLAVLLWGFTSSPLLAIVLLALADAFASLPTIIKAWKFPETETGLTYFASLVAVLLVLPSIPVWNIENSAFQIVLVGTNLALLFSVYRKKLGFLSK